MRGFGLRGARRGLDRDEEGCAGALEVGGGRDCDDCCSRGARVVGHGQVE